MNRTQLSPSQYPGPAFNKRWTWSWFADFSWWLSKNGEGPGQRPFPRCKRESEHSKNWQGEAGCFGFKVLIWFNNNFETNHESTKLQIRPGVEIRNSSSEISTTLVVKNAEPIHQDASLADYGCTMHPDSLAYRPSRIKSSSGTRKVFGSSRGQRKRKDRNTERALECWCLGPSKASYHRI